MNCIKGLYFIKETFEYKVGYSSWFQGICDGAAVVVLASEKAVKEHSLTPLARLVSYGIAGESV